MRIAILTIWADNYDKLAAITVPNMQQYCNKHGYDLLAIKIPILEDNSYGFEKIRQLKNILPDYDAVLCVDPDTIFTNYEIKIESFIDEFNDLFISKDINSFNAGVFLIKGTKGGFDLLDKILDLKKEVNNEQEAIEELYILNDNIKEVWYPNHLQSIPYEFYSPTWGSIKGTQKEKPTHDEGCWEEGVSFICHVPGLDINSRINILKNIKITE